MVSLYHHMLPRIVYKEGIHHEVLFRCISEPTISYDLYNFTVKRPTNKRLLDNITLQVLIIVPVLELYNLPSIAIRVKAVKEPFYRL